MTQDEVIKEFGRTQRRAIRVGFPSIIIGFAGIAYDFTHIAQLPEGILKVMFIGSVALFAIGVGIVSMRVCPMCHQLAMSNTGSGNRGLILFPDQCPNCGVRLTADPNAPAAAVTPAAPTTASVKKEQSETVVYYGARTILARKSYTTHMAVALVPFALFLWGPKILQLQLGAWAAFVLVGGHGVYRYFRIDACPACKAPHYFQRFHRDLDPTCCYQCGAQLIAEPDA